MGCRLTFEIKGGGAVVIRKSNWSGGGGPIYNSLREEGNFRVCFCICPI